MKKTIALLITIVLLTACVSALAEEARFVTINEWLDAKGECGDCYTLIVLYSTELYFHHQTYPKLSIISALDQPLHSF